MTFTVKEAILQRRSIKKFNGQLVEKEVVLEILDNAKWAPTHGNRQPWRVVVAAGKNLPKEIGRAHV